MLLQNQVLETDGFALKTHGIFLDHGGKVNISCGGQRQNTGVEVAIMAAKFGQEIQSSINVCTQ